MKFRYSLFFVALLVSAGRLSARADSFLAHGSCHARRRFLVREVPGHQHGHAAVCHGECVLPARTDHWAALGRVLPETFVISSWGLDFDPVELTEAGVKATESTERSIEASFAEQKATMQDWYQLERNNPGHRQAVTRKIKDPKWRGPEGAKLVIDVLDTEGGEFAVTFGLNGWSAYTGMQQGDYYAAKPIARSDQWQTLAISLTDLTPLDDRSPKGMRSWQYMTQLGIVAKVWKKQEGQPIEVAGNGWPKHRQVRNLRWVGGKYPESFLMPGQSISEEEYRRIFQNEIDESVELEKRDVKNAQRK